MSQRELSTHKKKVEYPIADLVETAGLLPTDLNKQRSATALQRALDNLGVTAAWIAERMKANAEAWRPITYMGRVTEYVPDIANRNKAVEQLLRVRGEYAETEHALLAVGLEISIDERRAIQVKAAARLGTWGHAYAETEDDIGDDEYPAPN